jgi:hypothetical protein
MKFTNRPLFVFLASASIFFLVISIGCKKSNSNNGVSGQVTASVNGTAFANNVSTQGVYASSAGEFQILGASYKSGDSTGIVVTFTIPFTLGNPMNSDTGYVDVAYLDTKTQQEYDGGFVSGHSILTVSSWDSTNLKVAGTFSGVLYNITGGSDSLVITGGTFNSVYTKQ